MNSIRVVSVATFALLVFLLFPACHGHARKDGWSGSLVKAAELDCIKLWSHRLPGAPSDAIDSVCHCVTDQFSTHYSTTELATPTPAESEDTKNLALGCVKKSGLDLARLITPASAGSHARSR